MTREDLLQFHARLSGEAYALVESKNRDYATGVDAFHNFRASAAIVGGSVEDVILGHIANKIVRIVNLNAQGDRARCESVTDSIVDLINYATIYAAWKAETAVKP